MLKSYIKDSYSVQSDQYNTYYIKPDYAVSNQNNLPIANAFSYMHKPLFKRVVVNLKETKIQLQKQVYFTIHFKRHSAGFFISIPQNFDEMLVGKMKTSWPNTELRKETFDDIPSGAVVGELTQKDYAFKSLNCSRSNLYPLTNMIGIVKSLQENEEVRVTIAIEPFGKFNWLDNSKYQLEQFKAGKEKTTDKSTGEKVGDAVFNLFDKGTDLFLEWQLFLVDSVFGIVLNDTVNAKNDKQEVSITIDDLTRLDKTLDRLSDYTRYKLNNEVFKTRIIISAWGGDTQKNRLNVMSIANSYKDMQGDNELVLSWPTKKEQENLIDGANAQIIKTNKKCILSDREISKLIQLPQRDLQAQYQLDRIDTREVDIPKELQGGKVRIGMAMHIGKEILTTFSENINVMALPRVLIGPQGVGKTTLLKRIVKDSYKAKQSNITIDVIEDCDTAKEVMEVVEDKDKVTIIVGTKDYIQPLAYTEVSKLISEEMDVYERVRLADLIAEQVEYLIDAVSGDRIGDLTVPMMRYLHSACLITFIKPMATLADVFRVLRDYKYRDQMVKYAKHSRCFRLEDEIFSDMEELDKKDKKIVVGTRDDLIVGILNRIAMLQKNRTVKEMLDAPIDTNQDFTRYIEEGKQVFIMIPQNKLPSQQIRDVIATYFVTRLWLTVQLRESNKNARLCNLIFDEVRIVPTTTKFISQHITEFRRHRLGTIFTCHYLKQFGALLDALKSAGASYIILAGTEKENIETLKQEIAPFTTEEVMNLKEHTSLNVVKFNSSEYAKFVTSQPKY